MIIKRISASGLRGPAFTHDLGTLAVIIGPNMSGKTRVLDAIRLAALGYIPGKDKTNPGIFRTASSSSLTVAAVIQDGENGTLSVERAWQQKGDGSISAQKSVPGNFPPVPLVVFDAEDYFGRTENARLQMVFERLNLGDQPINVRIGKVALALEAAGLAAAKQLLSTRQYQPAPSENYQGWLERALGQMKDLARGENETAKRMEQTVHGLTELAMQNPAALPDETTVRQAIAETRSLLEAAQQNLGAARQAAQNNTGGSQRVMTLERTIAMKRNSVVELPTWEATLAQLQGDLERHQAKAVNLPTLREQRDALTAKLAEHSAVIDARNEEISRLDSEYQALLEQKCCPTCNANKPTWRNGAKKLYDDARERAVQAVAAADAALRIASEEMERLRRDLLLAEAASNAAQTTESAIRQQQAKIDAGRANRDQIVAWQQELDTLRAQGHGNSEELAEAVDRAEQEVEGRRQNLDAAEAQLRAIDNARSDSQKLEIAQREREQAKSRAVQITEGARVLQESRDSLMMDAFTPLLQVANLFAAGILKTPLEFRRGELGRVDENNPARWISQAFFSGLELATMHCAISAALGSQSPIRLVLLDELGRLDSTYKRRFLDNTARAIADGVIDQLVAVDVAGVDEMAINAAALAKQQPVPITIIRTGAVL